MLSKFGSRKKPPIIFIIVVIVLISAAIFIFQQSSKDKESRLLLERVKGIPESSDGLSQMLFLITIPYADSVSYENLLTIEEMVDATDPECSVPILKTSLKEHFESTREIEKTAEGILALTDLADSFSSPVASLIQSSLGTSEFALYKETFNTVHSVVAAQDLRLRLQQVLMPCT